MKTTTADVVIIGSGASAGPCAFKLAQSGLKVTVLEKGDFRDQELNPEDEFAEIHLERHRPSDSLDPTVVISGEKISASTRVGQSFYLVGGGTVRYTATSWRLRAKDFLKKTSYGSVEGCSIEDWPITYEELEPYYTQAEKMVGISGLSGADPTEPFRSQNHLMPPLKEDNFQKLLVPAAKKLGLNPFPIPVAIHSEANAARNAEQCMQCGWCSGFPCRFSAKSSVDVVIYPLLKKTKGFTLKTHAYATKIVSKGKKIEGVEYLNLKSSKKEFIKAKYVIVAASAIQSARLLLLSKIANSSGLVGKNLMFHIEAKASALFPTEQFHQAYYKKTGINDFYFPGKKDGFINHRSIQSGSKAPPISFSLSRKGFGAEFAKGLAKDFLHVQELQAMVEDLPQENNRITLSADKKDPWGLPVPEVYHTYHEQDRRAIMATLEQMKKLLEASGGINIETPKEAPRSIVDRYTWHLMGTARMGNDPTKSVVNKFCQSHDLENLFITDGSVFPTSGGLNPTLTMQALSLRTADRILELFKGKKT